MSECFTPEKVEEAFLVGGPLIAEQILDLSIKHPSFLRDVPQMEEVPLGQGTQVQQLIFRGGRPVLERGFDKWKRLGNLQGCNPCDAPDCSYNTTMFGGHGFDRKITELMSRDFRTPSYCVHEIQTSAHFRQVFAKIIENIYAQTDFFKEMNIVHNAFTELSKKYVIDGSGAKCNTNNIYVYRNTGDERLSTLNVNVLEFFYEQMRRIPDVVPYDVVDGSPIYSMLVGHQLASRMYRDDPNLRQDVRFSGLANDLLMKYNFMSTVRGMFIVAPILYPRRFNVVAGEPVEVLPFINDVPAEVGRYTYLNPLYEAATHEEVILHGRSPFKILFQNTVQTLGGNTSFGPEFSFLQNWIWINPLTDTDYFRREGFFATGAKIGISQQFSDGIFSILFERPKVSTMAMYTPEPVLPPTPVVPDNLVPDVLCPCPVVLSITGNPFEADTNYFFVFATPVDVADAAPIQLQLDNGAYVTGEVVQTSTDGKTVEITFVGGLQGGTCANITQIFCDDSLGCSSTVRSASDCRSGSTVATGGVNLVLHNAIKALTVGDAITGYFGDCTSAELIVTAVHPESLTWTVVYGADAGPTDSPTGGTGAAGVINEGMICDRGGIIKVCVPPTTDDSCPACDMTAIPCTDPT